MQSSLALSLANRLLLLLLLLAVGLGAASCRDECDRCGARGDDAGAPSDASLQDAATGTGRDGSADDGETGTPPPATGEPIRSPGCEGPGGAAPTPPASGRFSIDVDGTSRDYIIKLPEPYDPQRPYRLVFAFHGAAYSAETVATGGPPSGSPYFGVEPQAQGAAIFVAAQALAGSWTNQNGRDVAYVRAMIARFKSDLCIDEGRIFAVGFSMGAIMTTTLACSEPVGLRGIAPMSGSLPSACPATSPVAYWGSHGTRDSAFSLTTGQSVRDHFRDRNRCDTTSIPGSPDGCVDYQGCDPGHPVTWCTFPGAHEPPPFAGEAIWRFLSAL